MPVSRKRKRKEEEPRRKRGRGAVIILLAVGFGAGMYFAGQARLFQSGTEVASAPPKKETAVKKSAPSKPKRAFGALSGKEEARKEIPQYTFFKTLNDSTLNNYVDLEGRVVKKAFEVVAREKPAVTRVSLNSHSTPQAPTVINKTAEKPKAPAVPGPVALEKPVQNQVEEKKKIKVQEKPKPEPEVKAEKPEEKTGDPKWVLDSLNALSKPQEVFRVQVASFKKFEQAQELETRLKKGGYVAFIRAIEIPDKGTWYRVFLGEYTSREQAEREAALAGKKLRIRPVVKKAG